MLQGYRQDWSGMHINPWEPRTFGVAGHKHTKVRDVYQRTYWYVCLTI